MSFTKDNGITDEAADKVMRLGEFKAASYEEALAYVTEMADQIGAPTVEDFLAMMGMAAFAQIGEVLGVITKLCMANDQMIRQLFDAATKMADATTTDPDLKQHGLGRMIADLTKGFIDTETRMRKAVLDGIVNELAGSLEVLGYGDENA